MKIVLIFVLLLCEVLSVSECFGVLSNDTDVCSGASHGNCTLNGTCNCTAPWKGRICEFTDSNRTFFSNVYDIRRNYDFSCVNISDMEIGAIIMNDEKCRDKKSIGCVIGKDTITYDLHTFNSFSSDQCYSNEFNKTDSSIPMIRCMNIQNVSAIEYYYQYDYCGNVFDGSEYAGLINFTKLNRTGAIIEEYTASSDPDTNLGQCQNPNVMYNRKSYLNWGVCSFLLQVDVKLYCNGNDLILKKYTNQGCVSLDAEYIYPNIHDTPCFIDQHGQNISFTVSFDCPYKYSCFGYYDFNTSACSGHGKCVGANKCECEAGYFGSQCTYNVGFVTTVYSTNRTSTNCPDVDDYSDLDQIMVRRGDFEFCHRDRNVEVKYLTEVCSNVTNNVEVTVFYDETCKNLTGESQVNHLANCSVVGNPRPPGDLYIHGTQLCGNVFSGDFSNINYNVSRLNELGFFWEQYNKLNCTSTKDSVYLSKIWFRWDTCLPYDREDNKFSKFYCVGDSVYEYLYSDFPTCGSPVDKKIYSGLSSQPCHDSEKIKIPYDYKCPYFMCDGIPSFNSSVCSGHGNCVSNLCNCTSGYTGPNCQSNDSSPSYVCYGVSSSLPNACSGHGSCVGTNNCSCLPNYIGDSCEGYSYFKILKGSLVTQNPPVYTCDEADSIPPRRSRGMAFSFLNYATYLFGGIGVDGNSEEGYFNDVWRFNTDNLWCFVKGSNVTNSSGFISSPVNEFSTLNEISARSSFGGFSSIFSFFVFGGEKFNGYVTNDLWEFRINVKKYNPHQWRILMTHNDNPSATQPSKRMGHCSMKKDSYHAYFFGGGGKNDLWLYDVTTNTFTAIHNGTSNDTLVNFNITETVSDYVSMNYDNSSIVPFYRSYSLCWIGTKKNLFIFGGTLSTFESVNDLWIYNVTNNKYAFVKNGGLKTNVISKYYDYDATNYPSVRSGSFFIQNQEEFSQVDDIFFFGGMNHQTGDSFSDVWSFSPILLQFRFVNGSIPGVNERNEVGDIGSRGYGCAAMKRNRGILIFGGEYGI